MNIFRHIRRWFSGLFRVWKREVYLVFTDPGVMLFFFALPLAYPIVYTLIYNPELVNDISIAVVDRCGTARSREFVRMVDATPAMNVTARASNLDEARRMMNDHDVFAILEIPADFDRRIGRGEQAVVSFYADMSLLLRYRSELSALTDLQMAYGAKVQAQTINGIGLPAQPLGDDASPVKNESVFLGDVSQGFASFVIPGIIILILHQSLILGVTMLAGGSAERRRRNNGFDPMMVDAPVGATIAGKLCCYLMCYIPMMFYIMAFVPEMFSLPHVGDIFTYMIYITPMLIGAALLGICLSTLVSERETSLLVIVFTSVVFLFLSGLTWPRYAFSPFWKVISDLVPATWGVEGFIRLNANHATIAQQSTPYLAMWALAAGYFVIAYMILRYRRARNRRLSVSCEKTVCVRP